jgi:hypothetical protein
MAERMMKNIANIVCIIRHSPFQALIAHMKQISVLIRHDVAHSLEMLGRRFCVGPFFAVGGCELAVMGLVGVVK